MRRSINALCAGLLAAAGCAASVPAEKMAASNSSIRAAEELGAPKIPEASLYLQRAKEENERAQKLIADGDPKLAEGQLLRAQADAELALAIAREEPMKSDALKEADKAR